MKVKINPAFIHLAVVLLVALLAILPLFPWRTTPASAPPEVFSAERALQHLSVIAREAHPSGSAAQAAVRDYLVSQLTALGVEVEVQKAAGAENVVSRLHGTDPDGAVLLLAHYDSYGGPGAADNGAGVAALLEVMRVFTASPAPRNDIIILFDDSEEMPDAFTGTKAFVRSHPWMADVRVAIGLDTAVRSFIATDDTGPNNGWLVKALARAYTGGPWTSMSGGGGYDTEPFRNAGIRVLELEDNYPFYQQHTPDDVPAIVSPGSLQQMGDQALSVARELSSLDLSDTSGRQLTYTYVPLFGLFYYPQAWALPLAILGGILLLIAAGLALRRKLATWRGLGVALLAGLVTAGLAAAGTNLLWQAAPGLFGWQTQRWHDWPEVIPPNGWIILILANLVVMILTVFVYRFARRISQPANFAFFGLFFILLLALVAAILDPRGAIVYTWPVIIGAGIWIAAAVPLKTRRALPEPAAALLAAVPVIFYILPLIPAVFMGDGTKSVAITAAVWVFILMIILPAVDGLLVKSQAQSTKVKPESADAPAG